MATNNKYNEHFNYLGVVLIVLIIAMSWLSYEIGYSDGRIKMAREIKDSVQIELLHNQGIYIDTIKDIKKD